MFRSILRIIATLFYVIQIARQAGAQPAWTHEIVRARPPDSGRAPELAVSEREEWGRRFIYLSAIFPNVPGLVCDLWCYESEGIEFTHAEARPGGVIEMRHRWGDRALEVVSTATPEEGALSFVAQMKAMGGSTDAEPEDYPGLNVCWQLRSSPTFASKPDPYPEFIKRCFIFTPEGRKFLHEIGRRAIPVQPATSEQNNPPWVQMYAPLRAGEVRAGSSSWADYSPEPFLLPLIGVVSRDRKYLAAMATESAPALSQAWHDCIHNNPEWLPAKNGLGREWRFRIYAMRNDPAELTRRFRADFPEFRLE